MGLGFGLRLVPLSLSESNSSTFLTYLFLGLDFEPIVETSFPELVVSFLDILPQKLIGTFSPVLVSGDSSVGRALGDYLEVAESRPLCATIFLPTMFACWYRS